MSSGLRVLPSMSDTIGGTAGKKEGTLFTTLDTLSFVATVCKSAESLGFAGFSNLYVNTTGKRGKQTT
jgi:hypothetical protein